MDRSRNLLQIGPLAVFEWSPRGTPEVTFVSANAEQLLELDVEALRSGHTSLVETIWEADRESFLQELEKCRQPTVTVEHRPFRLASRNGVPRWVLAQSCMSAPGSYATYVFVHAAIEKTETARRESEERYQQIFNTNLAVKLLIDPSDGQIHQANKAAARFYGYSQQQLEQMNISDINTLSDAEVAHEMDLARNEERLFFNFRHRLASGEIRDVEVFSGPVKSQETNLLYSIVFDVTDRHRAIEALEENQKHLSQTLLELEATQGQLVQRERLAAIGQVTAGIAHDFNNLLTGILGTAEMMRLSENLTKADLADLDQIVGSSERAANMIRQLMDFSRQSNIDAQSINLSTLAEEATAFLRHTIPDNILLRLDIETNQFVRADATQIQRVITNLVFNARDAMPEGGELRISVRDASITDPEHTDNCILCRTKPTGNWVVLEVSDTGIGIATADLPHILEPFFTTKDRGQGMGLGLSQVAGIISQHQGHLAVQSTVNRGTTFRVFLPPANADSQREAHNTQQQRAPVHGAQQCVLIVEDDAVVLQATEKMVRHLQYRTLTAINGQEALQLCQSDTQIDLVLSDIVMPELDGFALTTALGKIRSELPIILMSGYPLVEPQEDSARKTRWLPKPLDLYGLSMILNQALTDQ